MSKEKICILGAGFVGTTLAAHIVNNKGSVALFDIDAEKIKQFNRKETVIFEKNLQKFINNALDKRKISFIPKLPQNAFNVFISAIPFVPHQSISKSQKLYLSALRVIPVAARKNPLIIVRSTVPMGFTRYVVYPYLKKIFGRRLFQLAVCPERTIAGNALREITEVPQLIGALDVSSLERTKRVFRTFNIKVIGMETVEAAELAKLVSNLSRLIDFNLANVIGMIALNQGFSSRRFIENSCHNYKRLNLKLPGPGAGGFCLPKDSNIFYMSSFLRNIGNGQLFKLGSLNFDINENVKSSFVEFVEKKLNPQKDFVLVQGLAFKGNPPTNDTRGSVGVFVCQRLVKSGFDIRVFDRIVSNGEIKKLGFSPISDMKELNGITVLIIMNNDIKATEKILKNCNKYLKKLRMIIDPWGNSSALTKPKNIQIIRF